MDRNVLHLLARDWMQHDPDPQTRAATADMLAREDHEALRDHFGSRLQFGTAGLRASLGPGPNRMNRALVRQVTLGLADYLTTRISGAHDRGVVIGYDARRGSVPFAREAAAMFAFRGFRVWMTPSVTPTPICSFAMRDLGACAAVVVTASHNPPEDNGYKVFWHDGAQIVPPHDGGISAAIDRVERPGTAPAFEEIADLVQHVPAAVFDRYHAAVQDLRVTTAPGAHIVYSAMHGVGAEHVERALHTAGHRVTAVPEQREPDGAFPTVRFPNPEEPGALDLAKQLATSVQADAVFANDPDADRLAVAIAASDGTWHQLTGNQVGLLLADYLLTHGFAGQRTPMVGTTIVSSAMLSRMADHHGAVYAETLTGFKWLGQQAIAHDAKGGCFVMGFEEALGYTVGDVVRDKDGVSTALIMADLVAYARAEGQSLWDRLHDLYRQYGAYASGQVARKLVGDEGRARILTILNALRAAPPSEIGGLTVVCMRDLERGETVYADGRTEAIDLPRSNVLAWDLEDGSRVLARPSGTEPKIKLYFEARSVVGDRAIDEALREAEAKRARLTDHLLALTGL